MAEAKEVAGFVTTAAGLGMEFSGFAPSWVILQTIIFVISTGLAAFDTYTDWEVVLNFQKFGFDNPLLPPNVHWLRAWFFFTSVGTLLTVISVLHDSIDLLYSYYKSCQNHCCKCHKDKYTATNPAFEMKERNSKEDSKSEAEEEEIDDPCKCCFRYGWNGTTRSETLGQLTLWFQDVPMLTLAVLFALVQATCKTPEQRDTSAVYLDVGISATASIAAASWRLMRSLARLYSSIATRVEVKNKCLIKCIPQKSEAAYPPDTCAQYCIIPFYIGLVSQLCALACAIGAVFVIWFNYGALTINRGNFDDSLGIYRLSVSPLRDRHPLLFNISGTIIPPNGTFLNLEKIPIIELSFDEQVYCLSEFEYRPEDYQIYFNVAQLVAVSPDGEFCAANNISSCRDFYTFDNAVLYYASIDPVTGDLVRFDFQCYLHQFTLEFFTPRIDTNIDIQRHINRTGFPENGEPLVVYFMTLGAYVPVSEIVTDPNKERRVIVPSVTNMGGIDVSCLIELHYVEKNGRVHFNFKDVYNYQTSSCRCDDDTNFCGAHLNSRMYGYLTPDNLVVPYTHCSNISSTDLIPYYDPIILVECLC